MWWTIIRVWAVVNLLGTLMVTAVGIYRAVKGGEDNED